MICSHDDPAKRPSVYAYLKDKLKRMHLISVGRLDFNSEGLLVVTNDGELARQMELPGRLTRVIYHSYYYLGIPSQSLRHIYR
jgi:23S rRNA pseudouridine2605 synthase